MSDSLPVSVSRSRSAKLIPDGRKRVYPVSVKVFSSLFPFRHDSTKSIDSAAQPMFISYRTGMPMLLWDHQGTIKVVGKEPGYSYQNV